MSSSAGRDRVTQFAEDYIGTFDKFVWEIEQIFEGSDQVVVFAKVRSRPKGGGVDLVVRNGHRWTLHEGVVTAMDRSLG